MHAMSIVYRYIYHTSATLGFFLAGAWNDPSDRDWSQHFHQEYYPGHQTSSLACKRTFACRSYHLSLILFEPIHVCFWWWITRILRSSRFSWLRWFIRVLLPLLRDWFLGSRPSWRRRKFIIIMRRWLRSMCSRCLRGKQRWKIFIVRTEFFIHWRIQWTPTIPTDQHFVTIFEWLVSPSSSYAHTLGKMTSPYPCSDYSGAMGTWKHHGIRVAFGFDGSSKTIFACFAGKCMCFIWMLRTFP